MPIADAVVAWTGLACGCGSVTVEVERCGRAKRTTWVRPDESKSIRISLAPAVIPRGVVVCGMDDCLLPDAAVCLVSVDYSMAGTWNTRGSELVVYVISDSRDTAETPHCVTIRICRGNSSSLALPESFLPGDYILSGRSGSHSSPEVEPAGRARSTSAGWRGDVDSTRATSAESGVARTHAPYNSSLSRPRPPTRVDDRRWKPGRPG